MKLMETCKAGALRVLVRPLEDAMKIFGVLLDTIVKGILSTRNQLLEAILRRSGTELEAPDLRSTTVVTNFTEIAILAPRPGFFVGDCVHRDGETLEEALNPIVRHFELDQAQNLLPPPPIFPLGSLSPLPIEILGDIILRLGILSVISFRNVNQRAAIVVASLHEFNFVVSFPKALSTVIHMRCRFFSLEQLARSLHGTRCRKCKEHFGELLYLITAERICWSCWRRSPDFIPKFSKKDWQWEVPAQTLERIPHINGIPGKYGHMPPYGTVRVPGRMFDRRAAVAEQDKMNASQEQGQIPPDPELEPERARLRAPKSGSVAAYLGNWFRQPKRTRYIAFLRAPYFDSELQAFVGGYFCRACIGRNIFSPTNRRARETKFPASIWHEPWRRYTKDGFWQHVQKYGHILKDEASGAFVHDSLQRETQTPDDVQWEMYMYEDRILAGELDTPDDHPLPFPPPSSQFDTTPMPVDRQ